MNRAVSFHTGNINKVWFDLSKKTKSMTSVISTVKLKKKDGVPSDYEIIYRMGLESYIEPTKYIGFAAGLSSILLFPYVLLNRDQLAEVGFLSKFAIDSGWEIIGLWSFLLFHSIACLSVAQKVPIRMYFSKQSDDFIIVKNNLYLPWRPSRLTVKSGDVVHVEKETDIFQVNNFRHAIVSTGKLMYMGSNYFKTPFYYRKLLGIHSEEFDDDI